jgi:adenylate kinase
VIVVFLGPPGAGKGTQAKRLAAEMGVLHVSTGDVLRSAVERGTPLGREAALYLDRGSLVPDETMLALVGELLDRGDHARGLVLDGFPRTTPQAEEFDRLLSERGRAVDLVFLLDITEEEAVRRLTARVWCPKCGGVHNLVADPSAVEGICDSCGGRLEHRSDDARDVIAARFEEYRRLTQPTLEYYRAQGKLHAMDAGRPMDDVTTEIAAAVGEDGEPGRAAAR